MPIFVYQRTRDGDPLHGHSDWVSFGARPQVFFNKYVSLAFEGGFDYTDGFNSTVNGRVDGWVRKFTIAPQIGVGRKFFSRPVLRTFLTYANWSDGFRGLVGGVPYKKRTDGLSFRRTSGGDVVVGDWRSPSPYQYGSKYSKQDG